MIRVPEQWRGPATAEPLDVLAGARRVPDARDLRRRATRSRPPADIDDLEAADVRPSSRYEGAEHGFVHDASRPAHRADDAADAWRRARRVPRRLSRSDVLAGAAARAASRLMMR